MLYKKLKTIVSSVTEPVKNIVSINQNSCNTTLINGLNQTIFKVNDAGQWVYLNDEWEKLTGFSVAETLGTDMMRHVHPHDKKQCTDFIQDIYKNNPQSSSLKIRFLTKDDRLCWVNMRTNTFTNPANNKVHLIGVISDITDRVREYGLHQANYRTLYTLINNLCGLVYRGRNDREWTMEFVSDGCLELTGYHPSHMVNKSVTFGCLINPNDQELVWTNVQAALAENRPYEINYRIRTRSGEEKWVWERGKGNFSSNGELLSIEGLIVDITDYKRNYFRDIENILYKTKLKLPQKYLFMDRLDQAVTKASTIEGYKFSFLVIHIDHFNKLQNRYPADIIEKIILDISEIFNKAISPHDSLCMFDELGEFGILLEHTRSVYSITRIIKHIQNELLEPVLINDTGIYLTLSIGISINPDSTKDRKIIIKNARKALNRAKSLGGSRYEIFDEEVNARMYALDRMEIEIRSALENNELLICYQPIVGIKENIIIGIETQLFWLHPRRGKISADFFSPIEENNEIVLLLNQWILHTVSKQVQTWATESILDQNLYFIIQFYGEKVFSESYLNEIEQLFINNNSNFLIKISDTDTHCLTNKNIEFIVSMDNSKLLPCRDLMERQIKTVHLNNVSNIANDNDLNYLKAKIDFMHNLGMHVIINGIDTEKKFNIMKEIGCDYIQGDFISQPLESQELIKFVASKKIIP